MVFKFFDAPYMIPSAERYPRKVCKSVKAVYPFW